MPQYNSPVSLNTGWREQYVQIVSLPLFLSPTQATTIQSAD